MHESRKQKQKKWGLETTQRGAEGTGCKKGKKKSSTRKVETVHQSGKTGKQR